MTTKPQLITRTVEYCAACNARNSFRQQEGFRLRGTIEQAQAKCKACGQVAHIRLIEAQTAQTAQRPRPIAGRERRKCRVPLTT